MSKSGFTSTAVGYQVPDRGVPIWPSPLVTEGARAAGINQVSSTSGPAQVESVPPAPACAGPNTELRTRNLGGGLSARVAGQPS